MRARAPAVYHEGSLLLACCVVGFAQSELYSARLSTKTKNMKIKMFVSFKFRERRLPLGKFYDEEVRVGFLREVLINI